MNILFINIRGDQPSRLNNDSDCSVSSQAYHSLLCGMPPSSALDTGWNCLKRVGGGEVGELGERGGRIIQRLFL